MSNEERKELLDKLLQKLTSRKLMVFIVSTFGLFFGKIDAQNWVDVSIVYIGAEAAIDFIVRLRGRG